MARLRQWRVLKVLLFVMVTVLVSPVLSGCLDTVQQKVSGYQADQAYLEDADYHLAFSKYMEAARLGDAGSQYQVGVMYLRGQGVTRSVAEGVRWLETSANQGYTPAQADLGVYYYLGAYGLRRDVNRGFDLEHQAAAQGHRGAMYSLGTMYSGKNERRDPAQAVHWFQQAQSRGLYVDPALLDERSLAKAKPLDINSRSARSGSYHRGLIIQIQMGLNALGYRPGSTDGSFGPRTGKAIKAFQKAQGLPADGQPSWALLRAVDLATAQRLR